MVKQLNIFGEEEDEGFASKSSKESISSMFNILRSHVNDFEKMLEISHALDDESSSDAIATIVHKKYDLVSNQLALITSSYLPLVKSETVSESVEELPLEEKS